ncbi:MAG TPA: TIGR04283 family arsenosugar biosynthesis glycosyltransferase [Gammaproteobacteria bacterium]|nr:TIGR04283 family arsenosugar biosynthesis glycosyltransferase [Gammaproteobacteria bacterium]
MEWVSVIVPTLNEADCIVATLSRLQGLRRRGHEVIVVDGGSTDATRALAGPLADRVLRTRRGRGRQMRAGAEAARGTVLWFLHADTLAPEEADRHIDRALQCTGRAWGRFDVALQGHHPLLRVVGAAMNLRSRLTGIATGDQGLFVRRRLYDRVGGFPDIALMEDVALSRRLHRQGRPACLRQRLITSGRRWDQGGLMATIWLMWRLRLAYALGADPAALARRYST